MEAISKPILSIDSKKIRPFDVRRDLEQVANLVELCFADTLDADSKRYLNHMRNVAKEKSALGWITFIPELANLPLTGYVWQEDDQIVGNITLIPYSVKGKRFFLIANVAVYPEFRRRGIARYLTLEAMAYARKYNAPSIWLHVRQENTSAFQLYERLGFVERTRRISWISSGEASLGSSKDFDHFRPPERSHWKQQRKWLIKSYPPEISWHLPLRMSNLAPGILGTINRYFQNIYITQWAALNNNRLQGALSWQETSSHANALWLAVPPNVEPAIVTKLLIHARNYAPSNSEMMLNYPSNQFMDAIQQAGFSKQQTLIWMAYSFDK
jgi:ribosomal protein S18 acetylase RimI-like enzyme